MCVYLCIRIYYVLVLNKKRRYSLILGLNYLINCYEQNKTFP